ncbi:hypothetical protein GmHk_09G027104 [Glycine max]|nr:hypothetical protein GmHk_09G027104 [Glycine max]
MQSGGGAGGGPGRNPAGRAASTSSAAASPSSSSSAASHLESLKQQQQQQQQQQQMGSRQAFKEMETDGIIVSGNDLVQICAADAVNSYLASFSSHDSMHSSVDF